MTAFQNWRPEVAGWSVDILPFYARQARALADGATIIEIGVHHGRSILFLAEQLWALGKRSCTLYAIDPWSNDVDYEIFMGHHWRTEGRDLVIPIRKTSLEAIEISAIDDADAIFVDGLHDYESVSTDIFFWREKIKPSGGLLAGHDYWHWGEHAGVGRAVDEAFGTEVVTESSVWWVRLSDG